jgi:hypothetical protein
LLGLGTWVASENPDPTQEARMKQQNPLPEQQQQQQQRPVAGEAKPTEQSGVAGSPVSAEDADPERVPDAVLEQLRKAAAATASDGTGISGNVDPSNVRLADRGEA